MSQAHFLPKNIEEFGLKTRAYFSINPNGKLLLFVHGFGGSSTGTWDQFSSLLPEEAACAGCDLIFYGYDGLHVRSDISATNLGNFLDRLLTDPCAIVNPLLDPLQQRPASFSYNSVVIVAHSLGAVVSRRAVLNALRNGKQWTDKIKLALFAPAHMGANTAKLAAQAITALPWVGNFLAPWIQYKFSVLQDLETASLTLKQLLDDTEKALKQAKATYLIATSVVFGEHERIVNPNRFCEDPDLKVFKSKDHMQVCKPSKDFIEPIQEVIGLL
jgi:pimeloyl-ACP methyl ester carboxylesterase